MVRRRKQPRRAARTHHADQRDEPIERVSVLQQMVVIHQPVFDVLAQHRRALLERSEFLAEGVLELARLLSDEADQVELTLATNYLRATVGPYTLTTKLVDGKFPDYDKVIPQAGESELVGVRESLRQAFARAAILSNEKYRGVRLIFEPEQLTIQANNPEQEEAEEVVAVDYRGKSMEIGFNVSYLQDVLGVISSDSVRLSVADANSSALIEESDGGDCLYVVMPMRL